MTVNGKEKLNKLKKTEIILSKFVQLVFREKKNQMSLNLTVILKLGLLQFELVGLDLKTLLLYQLMFENCKLVHSSLQDTFTLV